MDLSDDIAYSVHDFEDAVTAGFVDVRAAGRPRRSYDDPSTAMHAWIGGALQMTNDAALWRLRRSIGSTAPAVWMSTWMDLDAR